MPFLFHLDRSFGETSGLGLKVNDQFTYLVQPLSQTRAVFTRFTRLISCQLSFIRTEYNKLFFLMVDKMKDDISSQHFTYSTRNFDFPTQFAFFIPALLNILTMWPLCFDSETSLQTGFVAGTTVMLGRIIFISALFLFFFYNVFSESCVVQTSRVNV